MTMLSAKDLHDLLNFQSETPDVVSLYLEVDASKTAQRRAKTLIKDSAEKEPRLQYLSQDLDRVSKHVLSEFDPGRHRGLAVFSGQARRLFVACPLPEPVKDLLRVGDRPYLPPLLNMLDQYRRYGVALVSEDKARFIEVHLGEAVECSEPQVEAKSLPNHPHRHVKEAADQLLFLARKRGFERVILGAPKELESLLINHLHTYLQNTLIVDGELGVDSAVATVLDKVLLGEQQSRKVRESVLVHRLLDGAKTGGMGVVGLWETLNALQRGEVRMLLVRDGLAKMGRVCPACGRLSLEGKRCHGCYQNTQPLFNLISETVQLALDLGCEVVRVLYDTRLDHSGGIGAELKFKLPLEAPAPKEDLKKVRP